MKHLQRRPSLLQVIKLKGFLERPSQFVQKPSPNRRWEKASKYIVVNGSERQNWTALFCGRESAVTDMQFLKSYKTPDGRALHVVQYDFKIPWCGAHHWRLGVLQKLLPGTGQYEETKTWDELAGHVRFGTVRILAGHVTWNDPLATALSKNVTVNTLLATTTHRYPIFVLGEVNRVDGFEEKHTKTAVAGGLHHNFANNPSIKCRKPSRFTDDTVKCIISVNGTSSNRPPESVLERTQKDNARKRERKRKRPNIDMKEL